MAHRGAGFRTQDRASVWGVRRFLEGSPQTRSWHWVSGEVVKNGGIANLAETDELIGAEHYVLKNVRNLETARRFLSTVERFRKSVSWHGHTARGQSVQGNNYRRLYNISIKSIEGRDEEASRRADRPCDRVRPEDGRRQLLLYG